MRVLYVKMDKLVEKKLFERLLPRAARLVCSRLNLTILQKTLTLISSPVIILGLSLSGDGGDQYENFVGTLAFALP